MDQPAALLDVLATLDTAAAELRRTIDARGAFLETLPAGSSGPDPYADLRARHQADSHRLARLVQRMRQFGAMHRPH